jgi:hypothetical protein
MSCGLIWPEFSGDSLARARVLVLPGVCGEQSAVTEPTAGDFFCEATIVRPSGPNIFLWGFFARFERSNIEWHAHPGGWRRAVLPICTWERHGGCRAVNWSGQNLQPQRGSHSLLGHPSGLLVHVPSVPSSDQRRAEPAVGDLHLWRGPLFLFNLTPPSYFDCLRLVRVEKCSLTNGGAFSRRRALHWLPSKNRPASGTPHRGNACGRSRSAFKCHTTLTLSGTSLSARAGTRDCLLPKPETIRIWRAHCVGKQGSCRPTRLPLWQTYACYSNLELA